MKQVLFVVLLLFQSIQLLAVVPDGTGLLPRCKASIDLTDGNYAENNYELKTLALIKANYCNGLLRGVKDTHDMVSSELKSRYFCIPNEVKLPQLVRIVVKYLEEHPEELHVFDSGLVLKSYVVNFPCI